MGVYDNPSFFCLNTNLFVNLSTLVGLKTIGDIFRSISAKIVETLLWKWKRLWSSTLLLCLHESLKLRPIIFGGRFISTSTRVAVIFSSD